MSKFSYVSKRQYHSIKQIVNNLLHVQSNSVFLGILLCLSGCMTFTGYPTRVADVTDDLQQLKPYFSPDVLKDYKKKTDLAERKAYRDEVVNGRIAALDINFNLFQADLYKEGIGLGIATDWAVLALGGATATVGGAATKTALGAVITSLTGAKAAVDKQVYFEQTMPALMAKMSARRKEVLFRIRTGLQKGTNEYPLTQALVDLESYYQAGTVPGAILGIAETAGAEGEKADQNLMNLL